MMILLWARNFLFIEILLLFFMYLVVTIYILHSFSWKDCKMLRVHYSDIIFTFLLIAFIVALIPQICCTSSRKSSVHQQHKYKCFTFLVQCTVCLNYRAADTTVVLFCLFSGCTYQCLSVISIIKMVQKLLWKENYIYLYFLSHARHWIFLMRKLYSTYVSAKDNFI